MLLSGMTVFAADGAEQSPQDPSLQAESEEQDTCGIYVQGGYISRVDGTATGTEEQEGVFPVGTVLEITADAGYTGNAEYCSSDVKWRFDRWICTDAFLDEQDQEVIEVVLDSADGYMNLDAQFTAVDADGTEVPMISVQRGSLDAVNGSEYANANFGYFSAGTVISLSTPETDSYTGQQFVSWKESLPSGSGDIHGTFADPGNASTTYTVPEGVTGTISITAQYGDESTGVLHTVEVANGVIRTDSGDVTSLSGVADGTELTIKGVPPVQEGYTAEFRGWSQMINDQRVMIDGDETFTFTVTDEMDSYISLAAAYYLTGSEADTVYTQIRLSEGQIVSVDGVKLDQPLEAGTYYYREGTILGLYSEDAAEGTWAQDALYEETVQGYFEYEDNGYALYHVPAQSSIYLYVLDPYAGNPPPASTTIIGGQVTAIDGEELDTPVSSLSMTYGSIYDIKAVVPADDADYTYEFAGWANGTIYGQMGIFRDASQEETQFLATLNGVIIAQYKAIPKDTVTSGDFTAETEEAPGMPVLSLASDKDELKAAVLARDEKESLLDGTDITVSASIASGDDISADDKEIVENAAETDGYTYGQTFDISLSKTAETETSQINRTFYPIEMSMGVPEDLQKENREYAVVRLHNGTADVLEDLDDVQNTVTFETDRFSYYTLVYKDLENPDQRPVKSLTDPETGITVTGNFASGDRLVVTAPAEKDLAALQDAVPETGTLEAYNIQVTDAGGTEIDSEYITGLFWKISDQDTTYFAAYKVTPNGVEQCTTSLYNDSYLIQWKGAGAYGLILAGTDAVPPEDPDDPADPDVSGDPDGSKDPQTPPAADAPDQADPDKNAPDSTDDSSGPDKAPQTGDTTQIFVILVLIAVSGTAVILSAKRRNSYK